MNLRLGFGLAALLTLTACAEEEPPTAAEIRQRAVDARVIRHRTGAEIQERLTHRQVEATYVCDQGQSLFVTFDNQRDMATVRLSNNTAVDLRQERAGSGIWYRAEGYELRGQGREARWSVEGEPTAVCRAVG